MNGKAIAVAVRPGFSRNLDDDPAPVGGSFVRNAITFEFERHRSRSEAYPDRFIAAFLSIEIAKADP
jgi:hypothetical protein